MSVVMGSRKCVILWIFVLGFFFVWLEWFEEVDDQLQLVVFVDFVVVDFCCDGGVVF